MPPWIGPGRTIATSTTKIVEPMRGRRRGSMDICARLSTWNTPSESALHSMSYTAGSVVGHVGQVRAKTIVPFDQVERLA